MAYIEPCCCDRQLPALLKESKGGSAFFQTSGDVTLQKLLDATAALAGDSHTLLLALPEADIPLLRTLNLYLTRGWTRALLLVTQQSQTELVCGELSAHREKVHYAADPLILDSLCAIIGPSSVAAALDAATPATRKFLILQGPILSHPDFSLCLYAAYLGTSPAVLQAAAAPLLSILRRKPLLDARQTSPEVMAALRA